MSKLQSNINPLANINRIDDAFSWSEEKEVTDKALPSHKELVGRSMAIAKKSIRDKGLNKLSMTESMTQNLNQGVDCQGDEDRTWGFVPGDDRDEGGNTEEDPGQGVV